MRVRTALVAALPAGVFCLVAMSMALNIRDRNVGKSSSFSVGKCLGFRDMAPVTGSIIIFCRLVSGPAMIMPLAEPGAARYWSLLGSGVLCEIEMAGSFTLRRHFFTRISSCENDHSSADSSLTVSVFVVFE